MEENLANFIWKKIENQMFIPDIIQLPKKRSKYKCIDENDKSFNWWRLFDFVIYNNESHTGNIKTNKEL